MQFKWRSIFGQFLLTIVSISLILCLPVLLTNKGKLSFQPGAYIEYLKDTFTKMMHYKDITYQSWVMGKVREHPLFPDILDPYFYSLTILTSSFLVALLIAVILSTFYLLSPAVIKKGGKAILFVLESMPDIMIILSLQLLLICFFKQTDFMPFRVITFADKRAYVLPILCLSLLPTIQLFRMLILYLEDEQNRPYVEVAKGKGLSRLHIIVFHLFRNVLIHLFHHSKTIFMFMLSNLFVLEFVFNINGIMRFLLFHVEPHISIIVIVMLFLPFYLLFIAGALLVKRMNQSERIEL